MDGLGWGDGNSLDSVHTLHIDELKGTKPTEKIDLSGKRPQEGGHAAAIIIASCIKGNGVVKELKCVP